jgi:PAS domain S-box-containing protein
MGESERPKVDPPADCPSWLQSLFDLSPDPMCLLDVEGYCKWVNPAFERTLGYTAEESVARPMMDFVHPEDVESSLAALEVPAGGVELRQFENRFICRDG